MKSDRTAPCSCGRVSSFRQWRQAFRFWLPVLGGCPSQLQQQSAAFSLPILTSARNVGGKRIDSRAPNTNVSRSVGLPLYEQQHSTVEVQGGAPSNASADTELGSKYLQTRERLSAALSQKRLPSFQLSRRAVEDSRSVKCLQRASCGCMHCQLVPSILHGTGFFRTHLLPSESCGWLPIALRGCTPTDVLPLLRTLSCSGFDLMQSVCPHEFDSSRDDACRMPRFGRFQQNAPGRP